MSYKPSHLTLACLCRDTIVKNLERYNAEAFQILDESEWEDIIRRKHEMSRPKRGKGGLDGTGRMNPAVTDKFLLEIETTLPHLGTSKVVDTLVWKDIVNFKFKSRPKGLMWPYSMLESRLKTAGETLLDVRKKENIDEENKKQVIRAIKVMCNSPMDVELLRSSGIGKSAQKFINTCSKNEKLGLEKESMHALHSLLKSWKMMASSEGVMMSENEKQTQFGLSEHIAIARKNASWRELFSALKKFDQEKRENQGARMRERRQRLNSQRPKIVKVRHKSSNPKALKMTAKMAMVTTQSKMHQLRTEAKVTSTRRSPPVQKPAKGFGAAVAFATGSHKRKNATIVDMAGGKRLKIPTTRPPARDFKRKMR
eukprot:CAMPEP_0113632318 /NCGR_PEP_ID=MMETSP0017_2-20120614/16797_1 /TAXON_ID=2856 /ORGANISM="Cylindrotheca closterium" /LENGTH=368 /DNA_ID=CAMNT_0000542867 /DNA_START=32 /DNA_END=1139 /DNA_ORIENTATION=+ /assembly_acc=CAM_ASM_000147